ncbi:Glutamyl-tRNA(Gln) amidotransferase subunit A [Listeria monocytogenes N53-1]|nr:Glutamyl-tRNA(Gln) amidotransferase subunit A [Listeria monocytogenes]CCQ24391.1 Glutamyl-tRNA(Gln) amidotransferase subunit A [Listeria monocytogenes N53-1]
MGLFDFSVKELHDKLVKKEISPFDLVSESFNRIESVEDKVGSFITLNKEAAFGVAEELGDAGCLQVFQSGLKIIYNSSK